MSTVVVSDFDSLVEQVLINKGINQGPIGPIGPQGTPGVDGVSITGPVGPVGPAGESVNVVNVTENPDKSISIVWSDGTAFTTTSLKGDTGADGVQGLKGVKGDSVTVEQVTNNGDYTFTIAFSDGTVHKTENLRGPQGLQGATGLQGIQGDEGLQGPTGPTGATGAKGDTGPKGDTGVSVHHIDVTNTTDLEGDIGSAGETDTYTIWGDDAETLNLGYFSVYNGANGGQGPIGPVGPAGPQGPAGVDGSGADDALSPLHGIYDIGNEQIISVNSDPTKFDIGAFNYYLNGVKYEFSGQTGISAAFAAGAKYRVINVTSTGVQLLTQNTANTPTSLSNALELGAIATADSVNIAYVGQSHFDRDSLDKDIYIWSKFAKGTNYTGTALSVSAGTQPLRLSAAGGTILTPEMKSIDLVAIVDLGAIPYHHVAGVLDFQSETTPIVVSSTQYDDGTGLVAIPSNSKWVSHSILYSSRTGKFYYIPSQSTYSTEAEAIDAEVSLGGFEGDIGIGVSPLAKIIVQKDATTISQIIDVRNQATNVVSASTSTLQTTYDRSTEPEIVTSSTKGALTIKGGTGVDTDAVYEGKNNAGTTTFAIQADGQAALGTAAPANFGGYIKGANIGSDKFAISGTESTGTGFLTSNTTFDGTNWRYIADGEAVLVSLQGVNGGFYVYSAVAGLAGEIATLQEVFSTLADKTVLQSIGGPTLVGTSTALPSTTSDHKLQVSGYIAHQPGWSDMIVNFAQGGFGPNAPTWVSDPDGFAALSFGVNDEVTTYHHVNHNYAITTNAFPHIHFVPINAMAVGETVVWELKYKLAKGHDQNASIFGNVVTVILTYTASGSRVAGNHVVLEVENADAFDLLEPDTMVVLKFKRLTGTYSGAVYGYFADIHHQSDRDVTIGKRPDFNVAD